MCAAIARVIAHPDPRPARRLLVTYLVRHVFDCCKGKTQRFDVSSN